MASVTQTEAERLSFGEKAVGLTFNPSGDDRVARIKRLYAEIIDFCNDERSMSKEELQHGSEQARLYSIAITSAQEAQMWCVKAITWRD